MSEAKVWVRITPFIRAMLVSDAVFPEFHEGSWTSLGREQSTRYTVPVQLARELHTYARAQYDKVSMGRQHGGARSALSKLVYPLKARIAAAEDQGQPVAIGARLQSDVNARSARSTLPAGWRVIVGGKSAAGLRGEGRV